ncbi:hypothetical protein [Nocardia sp. NPDC057030]|uniref:hypothetical protein n=1 Tax=unclassified Nocardia TaxID=2637762 RepID=UPI003631CB77
MKKARTGNVVGNPGAELLRAAVDHSCSVIERAMSDVNHSFTVGLSMPIPLADRFPLREPLGMLAGRVVSVPVVALRVIKPPHRWSQLLRDDVLRMKPPSRRPGSETAPDLEISALVDAIEALLGTIRIAAQAETATDRADPECPNLWADYLLVSQPYAAHLYMAVDD